MRQFDVVVCPKHVTVHEVDTPHKTYDISANVDGDKWLYRITKPPMFNMKDGWKERGYVHAFYHAKNAGNHVQFNRVSHPKRTLKKKRHPGAVRLF